MSDIIPFQARRPTSRARNVFFVIGLIVMVTAFVGIHDALASMATYTSALMGLNQFAPPLMLLGLTPAQRTQMQSSGPGSWLLDPWVAVSTFIALTSIVSLPQVFDRSLVNAVFAAPLGVLELAAGTMLWFQILPSGRRHCPAWRLGVLGWVAGMPMMVVGVVWIWSGRILYAPYLNVICQWNVTPLQDQRWAGMLMVLFGLPLQLRSAWLISSILLHDS